MCLLTLALSPTAGAGKTKIVSSVVNHIQEALASRRNDEAFAYFYYNRNNTSRRSEAAAICSLVRQLSVAAKYGGALPQVVLQMFSSKKKGQRELAEEHLHTADAQLLLRQLVEIYPQTTLVLDALDECDAKTRLSLVNLLDDLVQGAGRPVKVFIASRLDQDIRERFECGPTVAIRALDNQDDIARYIGAEMASRPDWTSKVSDSLCEEVVQTLTLQSQGMYVAAAYYLISQAP